MAILATNAGSCFLHRQQAYKYSSNLPKQEKTDISKTAQNYKLYVNKTLQTSFKKVEKNRVLLIYRAIIMDNNIYLTDFYLTIFLFNNCKQINFILLKLTLAEMFN